MSVDVRASGPEARRKARGPGKGGRYWYWQLEKFPVPPWKLPVATPKNCEFLGLATGKNGL
eukprot:scaffold44947_cov81-Cyclotella_meneghiniana.AAC.3